jgi:hypothetical protein
MHLPGGVATIGRWGRGFFSRATSVGAGGIDFCSLRAIASSIAVGFRHSTVTLEHHASWESQSGRCIASCKQLRHESRHLRPREHNQQSNLRESTAGASALRGGSRLDDLQGIRRRRCQWREGPKTSTGPADCRCSPPTGSMLSCAGPSTVWAAR